ncbi:MAG: hypothetical protein QM686_06790 [Herbaspirillum sp.]|uniref:Uncharacterized protein n=1 Tax=Herbaspirillum huttiense subsp. lycopersici TaxID=3074428 RepID=A0ABU2ET17_9BURK|nr:hypothetical protein [Herbaspirillum huttiense]MDR9850867.1 hypothetical protein [Herbaspirillum huttiense SE1]
MQSQLVPIAYPGANEVSSLPLQRSQTPGCCRRPFKKQFQNGEWMKRSYMQALLAGLVLMMSGCATIAPERNAAEELMGKDIAEAYQVFGRPWSIDIDTNKWKISKLYGQKHVTFRLIRSNPYTREELAGSYMDFSENHPTLVYQYETRQYQDVCVVQFWADKETDIIFYYDVQGTCGWRGWGFGQTGILHRMGM